MSSAQACYRATWQQGGQAEASAVGEGIRKASPCKVLSGPIVSWPSLSDFLSGRLRITTVFLKNCSPSSCVACAGPCPHVGSVSGDWVWMLWCDSFHVTSQSLGPSWFSLLPPGWTPKEGPLTLALDRPTGSHVAAASHSRTATTSFLPPWCPSSVSGGRALSAASAPPLPGGCRHPAPGSTQARPEGPAARAPVVNVSVRTTVCYSHTSPTDELVTACSLVLADHR